MELTDATRDGAQGDAASTARRPGLTVEIGGDALQAMPETGVRRDHRRGHRGAVVLVITFGSLVAAGLPLLTALIGVGIGVSTITALANVLDLGSTTSTLAMMIGLAVGIDYALFIVSRYRAELAEGREREEAAGRAVGTAGSAVVFAGLTVVIALVGLAVVNIPMLTKMGFAAAGTVVIAVLIALTLIPALLGFAGKRVLGRKARKAHERRGERGRRGQAQHGHPLGALRAAPAGRRCCSPASSASGSIALPASLAADGAARRRLAADHHHPAQAYDLLSEGFGPGFNGPLMVVVDGKGRNDAKAAADRRSPTIKKLDGRRAGHPAHVQQGAGDTATITVIPKSKPSSIADRGPGPLHPRHRRRDQGRHRGRGAGHRRHGDEHRLLAEDERRAAALSGARRRPGVPAADGGLPLRPGAAQGGPRLPALGGRRPRRGRRGLPVGLARLAVRRRSRPARSCR